VGRFSSRFIGALETEPHDSWARFLSDADVLSALQYAEENVFAGSGTFMPAERRVLRFLSLDIKACTVIIIGQDPYPQAGVATGRCFEVGGLRSWESPFRNISLKNIIRALYRADTGNAVPYKHVLEHMREGWPVLPPHELFKDWEKQGVLLLNTAFTVSVGNAGSHIAFWQPFSEKLLQYIVEENPDLVWFLWGNYAKKVASALTLKNVFASQHPMMCYDKPGREDDFLFGSHDMFRHTGHLVQWQGRGRRPVFVPRQQSFF